MEIYGDDDGDDVEVAGADEEADVYADEAAGDADVGKCYDAAVQC